MIGAKSRIEVYRALLRCPRSDFSAVGLMSREVFQNFVPNE
jgi:hypothetical protein